MNGKARGRGLLVALLCLLGLLGAAGAAVPFFLTPPAYLELSLRDSVFDSNLSGKSVQLVNLGGRSTRAVPVRQTDRGYLSEAIRVPSGDGQYEVLVDGFQMAEVGLELPELETVTREVYLEPTFGRLEVSLFNARTADEPVGVPVQVSVDGQTVRSDGRETVVLELDPGAYAVAAEVEGFCSEEEELASVVAQERTRVALRLSPDLTSDEKARIMLDWAENPRDLDSHVLVSEPRTPVATRHVFFGRPEGVTRGSPSPSSPGSTWTGFIRKEWRRSPCTMSSKGCTSTSSITMRGPATSVAPKPM